jgi:hypothetical protein
MLSLYNVTPTRVLRMPSLNPQKITIEKRKIKDVTPKVYQRINFVARITGRINIVSNGNANKRILSIAVTNEIVDVILIRYKQIFYFISYRNRTSTTRFSISDSTIELKR